jgi:hypothetical protein
MLEKVINSTRFVRLAAGLASATLLACFALTGCSGSDTPEQPPTTPVDASVDTGPSCTTGLTSCNGTCVDTKVSATNCGTCGATCDTGLVCVSGKCSVSCDGGTKCSNGCYDLDSDPLNCGACGAKCPTGQACVTGSCGLACAGGTTKCGTACVDTKVDLANCGACGTACAAGRVCSNGDCTFTCAAGLTTCGLIDAGTAYCANTVSDNRNCGACGKECDPGQACDKGVCAYTCKAGLVVCDGACVDPSNDRQHCGATAGCGADGGSAGTACTAGKVCGAGVCVPSCQAGMVACGGSCVDPATNRDFCGATAGCGADGGLAGTACAPGKVCNDGTCQLSCQSGLVNCSGTCVDPSNDRQYCGATTGCAAADAGSAGAICGAGMVCSLGACAYSCQQGLVTCGGKCINPSTDRQFCGATAGCGADGGTAGTACDNGHLCSGGTCQLSCQANLVECGGKCIDPLTDRMFCGATAGCGVDGGTTGTACTDGYVCSAGTCRLSCQQNLVSCGGKCIDPSTDRQYCGATIGCGADGGTTGTACADGQVCSGGTCQASCQVGLVACPSAWNTGLVLCGGTYIDPSTNSQYCGAWGDCNDPDGGPVTGSPGAACADSEVCSAGSCQSSCQSGLTTCPFGDGGAYCANALSDIRNCGVCGRQCNPGQACLNGACTYACIDPATNNQNCGATPGCGVGGVGNAGTVCAVNQLCVNGGCRNTVCSKNLARSSTPGYVTASTSGGGGDPALVIDGVGKTSCSVSSFTYVGNSPFPGNGSWIQLEWMELQDIDSFYVQTDDGAQWIGTPADANDKLGVCWNLPTPPGARNVASATVQWWDYSLAAGAGDWHDAGTFVNQTGNVRFNFPSRINTTKIRLLDMATSWANGYGGNSVIWEWHVYGAVNCQPTL